MLALGMPDASTPSMFSRELKLALSFMPHATRMSVVLLCAQMLHWVMVFQEEVLLLHGSYGCGVVSRQARRGHNCISKSQCMMSKDLRMLFDVRVALQPAKKTKKNDGEAAPKAAAKSDVDTSATNGSRTIFCKNLPWGATDEDLGGFFADCGEVTECRIGEPLFLYLTFILQAYSCVAVLLTVAFLQQEAELTVWFCFLGSTQGPTYCQ